MEDFVRKLLLASLTLLALILASTVNAKTIRIGTEGAYPPWNNLNAAGELEGAEIDFGNEACERMGVTCEWVTQDWDGIIPALLNGKYDIIIAGMSITEERKKKVNFTNGYMTDGIRFATLESSGLKNMGTNWSGSQTSKVNLSNPTTKDIAAIAQINTALDGKVVGAQGATTHQNYVEKYMQGVVEIRLYQTMDDLHLDLAAGRIDAAIGDVGSLLDFMSTEQGKGIAMFGPNLSGDVLGEGVGGAVRKEDTDILEMWNKAIAEMSADGTTAKITKKWFGRDVSL
ncbi:MAG: Nopaline-binding periplasmic protein [Alphaproteobacteria bacterium MarineAlpha5_Bin11]|nr:ABC transporter substrate-binding protein [Pelagibacteraceae bacterium]PPR44649.1 MAG: Nopaline-binding periplasmic protein [Alphaproteobacteria bacterium MarineAlpha5_Bin11]PPR51199.1 MAG: Nopaline-binding periplasmic protein [Alphaproteobacteria bacterium MarineAlpha5_Bin10]|tara:strand:- start:303 stop:1160 length:858 start_codon:yes stop_codon:yes gene_type:complete